MTTLRTMIAVAVASGCGAAPAPDSARLQNPASGLNANIAADGTWLSGTRGTLKVRWSGIGRDGKLDALEDAQTIDVGNPLVTLDHGAGLIEWWREGPLGLEQGFELEARPPGNGELWLSLAVERLEPFVHGARVSLRDADNAEAMSLSGLFVHDARGHVLTSELDVVGDAIVLRIADQGARYPLTIDPMWSEQQQLTASDAIPGNQFGVSMSVSGDVAMIGIVDAAYVFAKRGMEWSEQQRVTVSDENPQATRVCVSGDKALIGSHVFAKNGSTWTEQQELVVSDASHSVTRGVSLSGTTAVVVASTNNSSSSAAYVFVESGSTWIEQQKLTLPQPQEYSPYGPVSLSGDTLLVAASYASREAAYVFVRRGTTWKEQQRLATSYTPTKEEFSGWTVSVLGDTALVGAPFAEDVSAADSGAVYVFLRSGTTWTERQKLVASDATFDDRFGVSISMSAGMALIGAPEDDNAPGPSSGSVYVFSRSGDLWTEVQKLTASNAAANERFGAGVGFSGDQALIGAPGTEPSGSVYAFGFVELPLGERCAGDMGCMSGHCVDGVCCDTECGQGDLHDCQVCSIAAGASQDGSCEAAATECRAAAGECDVAERCDGASPACPADELAKDGTSCADGVCSAGECGPLTTPPVEPPAEEGCGCRYVVDGAARPRLIATLLLLALMAFRRPSSTRRRSDRGARDRDARGST